MCVVAERYHARAASERGVYRKHRREGDCRGQKEKKMSLCWEDVETQQAWESLLNSQTPRQVEATIRADQADMDRAYQDEIRRG